MLHIFGIRHHGPGSARSLLRGLSALRPDLVLVEGPPDADSLLPLFGHTDLQPPVALLVYNEGDPRQAGFFPLARFSPEWQAIRYALTNNIPVRFMDLPQSYALPLEAAEPPLSIPEVIAEQSNDKTAAKPEVELDWSEMLLTQPWIDPLGALAVAAGYTDGERWWEHMVEQRRESQDLFPAILEAMTALRETTANVPETHANREAAREAWMRKTIRAAKKEGFERIAIVCGAWHAPVLASESSAAADDKILKGLAKVKTIATLAPWTYGRLSVTSGYRAGVISPGWYDHLWDMSETDASPTDNSIYWLTQVAHLLRSEDLDASAAHVIEAVRLAESLAAIRGIAIPGLPELDEACRAVFCFGGDAPMQLIHRRLTIGERLGNVPDEAPMAPLQRDLQAEQRRLRLAAEANWKDIELDLRKPLDRDKSALLRRLNLLEVGWGTLQGWRP